VIAVILIQFYTKYNFNFCSKNNLSYTYCQQTYYTKIRTDCQFGTFIRKTDFCVWDKLPGHCSNRKIVLNSS